MQMSTTELSKVEQRRSQNRIAVGGDLRDSQDSKVNSTQQMLSQNDSRRGTLAPAFEASDESGESDGNYDPFDNLIAERGKSQAQRTLVKQTKRPSVAIQSAQLAAQEEEKETRIRSDMISLSAKTTPLTRTSFQEESKFEEDVQRERLAAISLIEKRKAEETQKLKDAEEATLKIKQQAEAAEKFRLQQEEEKRKLEEEAALKIRLARDKAEQEKLEQEEIMQKALEQKFQEEEAEKEAQIAQLQHEIEKIETKHSKIIEEKKAKLEKELVDLQYAIRADNKETAATQVLQFDEKNEVLSQVAALQAKVNEQIASIENLKIELQEPREKLLQCDEELEAATKALHEANEEHERLEKSLHKRRRFFEIENAGVAKEMAEVQELENQLALSDALVEDYTHQLESRQEQMTATLNLLATMDREAETEQNLIDEADEKLALKGNQEIIGLAAEANRLRHKRADLQKQKDQLQREAIEMQDRGIQLQDQLTQGLKKVKNMESYMAEITIVINDSHIEANKYREIIEQRKETARQEDAKKKEIQKIKKKIAAKKKRERQKSQQIEIEQAAELQRTMQQSRLEAERVRAATEMERQFNQENDSFISENIVNESQIVHEIENEESVILREKNELLQELYDGQAQMTADAMFDNPLNQSRLSYRGANDISFYSNDGRQRPESGNSFRHDRDDFDEIDMDTGSGFNLDDLMREKVQRDYMGASETLPSQHLYQTPVKDSTTGEYFVGTNKSTKLHTAKAEITVLEKDQKSVTEPSQLTHNTEAKVFSKSARAASDVKEDHEWLKYQEQNSNSPDSLLIKNSAKNEPENNMLDQIASLEKDSIKDKVGLMNQMLNLPDSSDDNSEIGSFHSDEVETPQQPQPVVEHKKNQKWQPKLSSIIENKADSESVQSVSSDETTEVIRVTSSSAVAANFAFLKDKIEAKQEQRTVLQNEKNFGVVGPESIERYDTTSIAGSVQVAKEETENLNYRTSSEEKARTSSWDIRQKILLATTPRSKIRVIQELTDELLIVNSDISSLQKLSLKSRSPELNINQNSKKAVPIVNPSNETLLKEKFKLKDQIEAGLKTLQDRDRKEQERQNLSGFVSSLQQPTKDAQKDPYAPTENSSFLGSQADLLNQSRFSQRSSMSRSSLNRSSSRGSLYHSTKYDRQGKSTAEKDRKKTYIDMAMREVYFMTVSKRHIFATLSDYEVMEGFNQFSSMLKQDKTCHEAMFGLGKLNFQIKRYELAERWFNDALALKRDQVYRAWVGFTYVKLYEAVTPENSKKDKYLGYAIKNLNRCAKEEYLAVYALTVLIYLSVSVLNPNQLITQPQTTVDIEEPQAYLARLSAIAGDSLETSIATAYVQLNTPGQVSQGIVSLKKTIKLHPSRPEPYLVLISHFSNRKQFSEEKSMIQEAVSKCSTFHSYPERLLLTLLEVKNLVKSPQVKDHLDAANLLQLQYTRTPHFASSLLYAYGKTIIDCRLRELLPNAISALEEAQKCSVSLRVHNCFAYIAKAFNLLQNYPLHVCMHALQFKEGSQQLTHRVGQTSQKKKQAMIEQILKIQNSSNTKVMYDVVKALKEAAIMSENQFSTPRYSSITFIEPLQTSNSRVSISQSSSQRLNMFTSPLSKLAVQTDQADKIHQLQLPLDPQVQLAELTQMTNRFDQNRDRLICQGMIIRALSKDVVGAYSGLFSDLLRLKSEIKSTKDVQLQTLLVRSLRKSNRTDSGLDPMQEATNLIAIVRNTEGRSPPLTTACIVDAHLEAAKLFFKLSLQEQQGQTYSSSTLLQLALNSLLSILPVLPTIDQKLGNPRLPIEIDKYAMIDLDLIDFQAGDIKELTQRIQSRGDREETKSQSTGFGLSSLMQVKMDMNHYMTQGIIPIDPKKRASELEEDQCAAFWFPETMAEEGILETSFKRWTSTSLFAVTSFLASEGVQTTTPSSQVQQSYLSQFNVHNNPNVLKNIGKFCLKSKKFSDLAIYSLKEYLSLLTYSKMFSLGAGQSLSDDATVQSGYTLIRDKTMLYLAQALALNGSDEAKRDAQTLVEKVKQGGNVQLLRHHISVTTEQEDNF